MSSLRRFSLLLALALAFSVTPAFGGEAGPAKFSDAFARDVRSLDAASPYGAFVHFTGGSVADHRRLLENRGLDVVTTFPAVDVVFATGTIGSLTALQSLPQIAYLEANTRIELLGDTATWATRAKFATERVGNGPYLDASGAPLDGGGVGVAVIDSGIDSTHPDLADNTVANYKVVCTTPFLVNTQTEQCFGPMEFVEEPYTDATGGHGTHVAGIVAGDGTASEGTFRGVAPSASLVGYGIGEGDRILYIAEAFQHIIDNYDTFVPRIRVINNSYGDPGGSAYDPNSVYSKLVDAVVAKGVTVVFAAGNDGGDGSVDSTSSFSKSPTPGVISAANYDDNETGSRDNALDSGSSRGHNGHPETYPDLAAPGAFITSTCRPTMPICDLGPTPEWAPNYATLSGTSMASPHIAGAAALLYQARPDLTPAQVEDVLQDSAHRFTAGGSYESDPQNSGGLTSFDKGAGLLDVTAALDALGVANSGYEATSAQSVFAGDGGELPLPGEADIEALSVDETASGLSYRLTLRDLDDSAPLYPSYRLLQNVDGEAFTTTVNMTATGPVAPAASASTNSAPATQVAREGNDIVFFVPFSALGEPTPGSAGHNVWVASYQGGLVDSGPGGTGPDQLARPRFGDYTIYRGGGGAEEPVSTTTQVSFTAGSATAGQYSDSAIFEMKLVDDNGAALAGEAITLAIGGTSHGVVTTDEDGVARTTVVLDEAPGDYIVRASYGGRQGRLLASATEAALAVSADDSALTVVRNGRPGNGNGVLEATVVDADAGSPLAARPVTFYSGTDLLGTATTDDAGVATIDIPARYSSPKTPFSADFDGDELYLGSSGSTS